MGNQQPVFNRLEVPSFGLVWLNIDDSAGDAFVLIPGGGGSTKSGVKNQIQIGKVVNDKTGGFEFLRRFETDVDGKSVLCSGVAVGICMGKKVVCAFLDNHCAILTVEKVGNDLLLERVVDFKADFSEDGSVNCACILPSGHIVTGGDDGVCRLWAVGYIKDSNPSAPAVWRVRMLSMMEGHTAAIMDISHHPDDALISTAAKDGTCKIWNVISGAMLCDVPFVAGLPGSGVAHKANPKLPVGPIKMECRGCCFSADGGFLYAIQSGRRGATHLVEWEIIQHTDDKAPKTSESSDSSNNESKTFISVSLSRTKSVCKVPSTRLKISEGGEYLAVGASDGTVNLIDVKRFSTVSVSACHDLPATGLGFAPSSAAKKSGLKGILVSCSADNRLAMIKIEKDGFSNIVKAYFVILSLMILAVLIVLTAILFDLELPGYILSFLGHSEEL